MARIGCAVACIQAGCTHFALHSTLAPHRMQVSGFSLIIQDKRLLGGSAVYASPESGNDIVMKVGARAGGRQA